MDSSGYCSTTGPDVAFSRAGDDTTVLDDILHSAACLTLADDMKSSINNSSLNFGRKTSSLLHVDKALATADDEYYSGHPGEKRCKTNMKIVDTVTLGLVTAETTEFSNNCCVGGMR